jgi:transposase InsO family protein
LKNKTKPYKYANLLADMASILEEDTFNQTYGKQRMYEKLQLDYECPYCYNTVAKVMSENGLLQKENKPKGLTKADKQAQKSDNLLNQDFSAEKPCEKTVTDITEFAGSDGKIYVSGVFDCFDNACLGLEIDFNMQKELVISTFRNASLHYDLTGAISHSDRGSQYTSVDFRELLAQNGIIQSMNSAAGRCHDNAKCESIWARAKSEIMACYDTKKMKCLDLIPLIHFYFLDYWNHRRICSAIGGVPPMIKRNAYFLKLHDSEFVA